jgi:PTS system nitrogen regulatory IIA component
MQLRMRDAAQILCVSEKTIRRWINQESLPTRQVGGQYWFSRTELLEWATLRHHHVSPDALGALIDADDSSQLADAFLAGAVLEDVAGDQWPTVLETIVHRMRLPEAHDRRVLIELFAARGGANFTAIAPGLAIPHPRHPLVLRGASAAVTLAYLQQPLALADGATINSLFVITSPTMPSHRQLLSGLISALARGSFRDAVAKHASAEVLAHLAHA